MLLIMMAVRDARFCPLAFLNNRASRSVVEACVSLLRFSPRKSTLGLPASSVGGVGLAPFFLLETLLSRPGFWYPAGLLECTIWMLSNGSGPKRFLILSREN